MTHIFRVKLSHIDRFNNDIRDTGAIFQVTALAISEGDAYIAVSASQKDINKLCAKGVRHYG